MTTTIQVVFTYRGRIEQHTWFLSTRADGLTVRPFEHGSPAEYPITTEQLNHSPVQLGEWTGHEFQTTNHILKG